MIEIMAAFRVNSNHRPNQKYSYPYEGRRAEAKRYRQIAEQQNGHIPKPILPAGNPALEGEKESDQTLIWISSFGNLITQRLIMWHTNLLTAEHILGVEIITSDLN